MTFFVGEKSICLTDWIFHFNIFQERGRSKIAKYTKLLRKSQVLNERRNKNLRNPNE